MQKIPKGIVAIAIVIVVTAFIYYRYTVQMFATPKPDETTASVVANKPKEVSTVITYEVTGYDIVHDARFTVALDDMGVITDVKMVEDSTGVASDKQAEFATNLSLVIKGKKLSELTAVDRVGTSTITTNAFNSAIDKLKAQL